MRISRKFNLARIGHQYESVDIEIEGENTAEIIVQIEEAWRTYSQAIVNGDGRQMLEAHIEPKSAQAAPPERKFDLDKIQWVETKGTSGMYLLAQEADNAGNLEYVDLYKHLEAQKGGKKFMGGTFLWIMSIGSVKGIGRIQIVRQKSRTGDEERHA